MTDLQQVAIGLTVYNNI
uniref:Uncharacterized protein n=1 Tax=Lepeophtheirus salmonis TaxID=72036 RepID=A0A0K2UGC7_LEPSM